MKGYVNLTHTNNSAIEKVSQKVDEIQDDYISKDTTELTNYYTKNQTYSKEEIDNKTTNVYRAKGSVQTYQDLPTENNQVGDVYNVIEAYEDYPAGTNFVWTDTSTWDALGGEISIIQGVSQEDFDKLVNNVTYITDESGGFSAGKINETSKGSINIGNNNTTRYTTGIAIGSNILSTDNAIIIGQSSSSQRESVVIGNNSTAGTFSNAVVIGNRSRATSNSIQLGKGTNTTSNSFQVFDDNIYKADTHTLTVQNAEINGTPAYGVLSGTSAPTTTTVGAVGQFYLDTTNKQLYQCMSITTETIDEVDTNVYEWQEVGGSSEISNKLYLHSIIMTSSNYNKITTILINSSSNQFNVSSLNDWLISNGFIVQNMPADDNSNMYLASGSQDGKIVNGIYSYASNELYCNCSLKDDNGLNNSNISLNNYNFIDTVIEIL